MTEYDAIDIFAGNLQSLMNEVGYDQKSLAIEARLSQSTISKYLNRQRMPTMKALNNLCLALHCTIDELIGVMDFIE